MLKGRSADLSAWIDALPGAQERAQACLSAAAGCPQLAGTAPTQPTGAGDQGKVFKPIDTTQSGTYGDGKWGYSYAITTDGPQKGYRQGFLKYDARDLLNPQPGDIIQTPWGWMQWQDRQPAAGNWLPVAEKPAKGKQLPDPATHPEIVSRPPPGR